jgi:hypothetical protein
MYYYEVQVIIPNEDNYTFGVKSEVELSDKEIINIGKIEDRFKEEWDDEYIDSIEQISEKDYLDWYENE